MTLNGLNTCLLCEGLPTISIYPNLKIGRLRYAWSIWKNEPHTNNQYFMK